MCGQYAECNRWEQTTCFSSRDKKILKHNKELVNLWMLWIHLDHYLDMAPPVTALSCWQWWGTNSNSLEYISWRPFGLDFTTSSTITYEKGKEEKLSINVFRRQKCPGINSISNHVCFCFYLVHVRFNQHLSYQSLSVSCLVYGGICPQAVTHHVHIGCLQTLNQQPLQRLLQHGGDPCDTLTEDRTFSNTQ